MKKQELYIVKKIEELEKESKKVLRWKNETKDEVLKRLWDGIFWEKRSALAAYRDILDRLRTKKWKEES